MERYFVYQFSHTSVFILSLCYINVANSLQSTLKTNSKISAQGFRMHYKQRDIITMVKVKVSHNRPRWPKGFQVG
jgi:hypothetical protein